VENSSYYLSAVGAEEYAKNTSRPLSLTKKLSCSSPSILPLRETVQADVSAGRAA
jgi:hypothetical protein